MNVPYRPAICRFTAVPAVNFRLRCSWRTENGATRTADLNANNVDGTAPASLVAAAMNITSTQTGFNELQTCASGAYVLIFVECREEESVQNLTITPSDGTKVEVVTLPFVVGKETIVTELVRVGTAKQDLAVPVLTSFIGGLLAAKLAGATT